MTSSRSLAYWGDITLNAELNGLPPGKTAIGYTTTERDDALPLDTITIPEEHRLHAMVLGSSGYGKSTILKMLIRQNLIRGEGVAVLDPQHDLAAWAAQRIPRWRANHLVYISPAQLLRTKKAIPINPLEAYGGAPGVAAAAFAETLLKAFDTGGVRMAQLLTQAATSLIATGQGGLGLLRRIILDKSERDAVLANVHLQDNLDFWDEVFPKSAKESVPAVDNKLTPIITNPAVGPFFEGDTAFDMKRLIDNNGILIFDGAGCNNDGERTIFTTFLLNMITTAAAKLAQSRPQGMKPTPFYLYVDEMQMLESEKLKEMLQLVRKWGIRMTLATQQLESIETTNAAAMLGNCDLYVVSRCTPKTASMISPKMGTQIGDLTQIPKFHMSYHMGVPAGDIHGTLMRTRHIDRGPVSWETLDSIVDHSLVNYGVDVDMTKYTNKPEHLYDVSPLEMAIYSILFYQPDGLKVDDIHAAVKRFGAEKRKVAQILQHAIRKRLVEAISGTGVTIHKLRTEAINRYFDVAALKGRAGGDIHINTIKAFQDNYARRGYYTRMDVGDTTAQKPDLEVCEPAVGPEGGPDENRWGTRVAIEVETAPGKHPNKPGKPCHVYKNYKKNHSMTVWFLVYNDKSMGVIERQLLECGIKPEQYYLDKIDYMGGGIPVPPGFTPMDPLPFCIPDSPLKRIILDFIPKEGLQMENIEKLVPDSYKPKEVAKMIDSLVNAGIITKKPTRKGLILRRVANVS